jgi:hypothetical protein
VTNPPLVTAAKATTPPVPTPVATPTTLAFTGAPLQGEMEWALGLILLGASLVLFDVWRRRRAQHRAD